MNFYVIKIQNFCDRAKPWLGKVEALFHAIHPLLLGYEKRVCRNFDTPSTKRLSINFNVDYQYYHEAVQRNTVFADALARYRFKKVELELECNNLFNAKNYMAISKTNMSTFISRYELRPVSALLKVRFKLE